MRGRKGGKRKKGRDKNLEDSSKEKWNFTQRRQEKWNFTHPSLNPSFNLTTNLCRGSIREFSRKREACGERFCANESLFLEESQTRSLFLEESQKLEARRAATISFSWKKYLSTTSVLSIQKVSVPLNSNCVEMYGRQLCSLSLVIVVWQFHFIVIFIDGVIFIVYID
jgi:hypothetical protein